jgi:hypothetical protein
LKIALQLTQFQYVLSKWRALDIDKTELFEVTAHNAQGVCLQTFLSSASKLGFDLIQSFGGNGSL